MSEEIYYIFESPSESDIKKIEKVLAILKTIPKEKHYIMHNPISFKEIDIDDGFVINSNGYLEAWDKDGEEHWFKPEHLCTLEEVKQKVKFNRVSYIKSSIKMKQIQLQDIEKEIAQLRKELNK